MFLDYYNLGQEPFGVTPDSRFLYMGPSHREALASLVYGTERNRGFLALIAKPGMGKTSLLFHLLTHLRDKARTAFVFRTDCESRQLIRHILLDLGVDVAGMDLPGMHDSLNRLLIEEMRLGRQFVLVIDEAQNLDEKALESVRLLSNFETPWVKLMQIVLAGQPQLADRLASASLAQLRQRVSMVIKIDPFTHEEVSAYIDHRLSVAGCKEPSIFSAGARKLIAEHSEGIPRNINNLCFNALSLGFALQKKTIDRDIVLNVIADLDLEPLTRPKTSAKKAEEASNGRAPLSPGTEKKRDWIPKMAITSGMLIALGCFVVGTQREVQETSQPPASIAALPATVAPPIKSTPGLAGSLVSSDLTRVQAEQAPGDVRVTPGQTLHQISVNKLGKYDAQLLEEFQELNPDLKDPNHIVAGQKLRIPGRTIEHRNAQLGEERVPNAVPAKEGNQ